MPRMTDAELVEIEARVAKAVPGPWEWDKRIAVWLIRNDVERERKADCLVGKQGLTGQFIPSHILGDADQLRYGTTKERDTFDFIAHAREDVPTLLAETRRLCAENARLKTELVNMVDACERMHKPFPDSSNFTRAARDAKALLAELEEKP